MRRFARVIEGSQGTVVFGNGVEALVGHVESVGEDDCIEFVGLNPDRRGDVEARYVIPVASIAYWRFADEHDA